VLSTFTFLGGVLLLRFRRDTRGDRQADHSRSRPPLAVIELSHFVGSIIGVALLVLSQGCRAGSTRRTS
jgi:lysylphosphatidylglycerol synthetase-like protein (DUF2156 family)